MYTCAVHVFNLTFICMHQENEATFHQCPCTVNAAKMLKCHSFCAKAVDVGMSIYRLYIHTTMPA